MNVIHTENLTKYYGKERGIINLNLRVKKGEIFGFIGPNGAGKSTTIRTRLGVIFPTSGRGEIFGLDIVKKSKEIKKKVGFMPSEVNFYDNMKVNELLEYSARFYGLDCSKQIFDLADIFRLELDRNIQDLSAGNKKKVAILQSLIHKPELLILDEPTSGLDPLRQAEFFSILRKVNKKGVTIFFSSHVLSEVQQLCDRVTIIKEGKIIKTETIKDLRGKHLWEVVIKTPLPAKEQDFTLTNQRSLKVKGHTVNFYHTGEIRNLLKNLSDKDIEDLTITHPSLEEVFLHYYEN